MKFNVWYLYRIQSYAKKLSIPNFLQLCFYDKSFSLANFLLRLQITYQLLVVIAMLRR